MAQIWVIKMSHMLHTSLIPDSWVHKKKLLA